MDKIKDNLKRNIEIAETLNNEMHLFIDEIMEYAKKANKKISYDSFVHTYFLLRIAELENKIENLK